MIQVGAACAGPSDHPPMTQSLRLEVPTLNKLLALRGITRLALVTQYTADLQQPIVDNDRAIGVEVEVVAVRQLVICVNHDLAIVATGRLPTMVGEIAEAGPQAITTLCTNLRAAPLAEFVEAKLGIPLLDTVSPTVGQLRTVDAVAAQVRGRGHLFGRR